MRINYEFVLRWKCDGSEEIYDNKSEILGRINTLENQGYEQDVDFSVSTRLI